MTIESASFINGLNASLPAASDPKSEGDDHLRLIKSTVKATFPNVTGAVTPTQADLNVLAGAGTGAVSGLNVTTQAATNNSTLAASTAMVQSAILASTGITAVLPSQSGNAGKYLFTDGSSPSWQPGGDVVRSARSSNTILAASDKASLIDITSGTFTQTFTAAATLGNGWYCWIRNAGAGNITLDPNASETIDGLTSYVMYPGECRLVQCDGTGFNTIVVSAFSARFTTTFTMTKPPGYNSFLVGTLGGGGGGGSGASNGLGSARSGGGGGGGGERKTLTRVMAADLGATFTVTVGAAGVGGASVTGGANGISGTAGGSSSFGGFVAAAGGGGGSPGGPGSQANGGDGGGSTQRPSWMTGNTVSIGSVGGQASNGTARGTEWGGAAGGDSFGDSSASGNGGTSVFGGSGGGAGAGFGAGPVYGTPGTGGTGAGNGGASGGTGTAGANATVAGCGGGGGGGSGSGSTTGKGGDGMAGFVLVFGEA